MKKILLFLFLSFITALTYAQSDTSKLSSRHMIEFTKPTFFKSGKFYIDGKQQTVREVNTLLMNSPASASEYKEFKKYRNLTTYMFAGAMSCLVASLITNGNANTYRNTPSKILLGVGCAFIIPEFIFAGKRNRHYRQSFDSYNRQFQ